jgi:hypothetical protein
MGMLDMLVITRWYMGMVKKVFFKDPEIVAETSIHGCNQRYADLLPTGQPRL